jgi:hypothetical protein
VVAVVVVMSDVMVIICWLPCVDSNNNVSIDERREEVILLWSIYGRSSMINTP